MESELREALREGEAVRPEGDAEADEMGGREERLGGTGELSETTEESMGGLSSGGYNTKISARNK